MDFKTRVAEGQDAQPLLLWDSVWSNEAGIADWALAGSDEPHNQGGLRARSTMETAVILCLFTDRRCPDDHPLRWLADDDRRGWWGDGVDVRADLGEAEMGSLLWLLKRAPVTVQVSMWAEAFARDALQPLINQGAAARIDVTATPDPERSKLTLLVGLYGRDGQRIYARQFEAYWRQA